MAAIILLADDQYLLQHRDAKPDIFYPGHWGFFGGALEPGEFPETALTRELDEELGIRVLPSELTFFSEFTFDFRFVEGTRIARLFFECRLKPGDETRLRLSEGQGMAVFRSEEALTRLRMTPYDGFALWMHAHRGRFVAQAP